MDWTNKHFHAEAMFAAPRERVMEAVRSFAEETLLWSVRDVDGAIEATGHMAGRRTWAQFRVTTASGGTSVAIELLVPRAGLMGYMLFDGFGYFGRQVRSWPGGIQRRLENRRDAADTPNEAQRPSRKLLSVVMATVYVVLILVFMLDFFVLPLVGLATGDLYFIGRGGGGLVLQGIWGRSVSAAILLAAALVVWRMREQKERNRRPKILGP